MKTILKGGFVTLLLFITSVAWSQNITISGKVLENGNPLSYVTILVQGTDIGTTTDINGEYTISVPPSATTLVISYLGYTTVEEPINGRTKIDVNLTSSAQELDAVVITALGIKRSEKALGYSVQKVAGDNLQRVQGLDVATSLTGKVAGVLVRNS